MTKNSQVAREIVHTLASATQEAEVEGSQVEGSLQEQFSETISK